MAELTKTHLLNLFLDFFDLTRIDRLNHPALFAAHVVMMVMLFMGGVLVLIPERPVHKRGVSHKTRIRKCQKGPIDCGPVYFGFPLRMG